VATGFYGGFFQAGIGILLMAALLLAARFSLKATNGIKALIVLLFNIPAFLIFWWSGHVEWVLGSVMAAGQSVGAWLATRFAVGHPQAALWTRRLLIAEIIFSIVKIFKLYQWFWS
jgi:uncharacterized membrane protein YfcA